MNYLTFALAKGRLARDSMALLAKIGVQCLYEESSRKLIFANHEEGYKFFLPKASDVPTFVEYGAADIGIVGKDTLLEERRNLCELVDMGIGKCRMVVAGKPETNTNQQNLRVATKYPNIASDYFFRQRKQTVEIIKLNGSVELAPMVGLSDVIVDIVESGVTLKENGLVVLEEICQLSARLVVNRVSMKLKHEQIAKIVRNMKAEMEKSND